MVNCEPGGSGYGSHNEADIAAEEVEAERLEREHFLSRNVS